MNISEVCKRAVELKSWQCDFPSYVFLINELGAHDKCMEVIKDCYNHKIAVKDFVELYVDLKEEGLIEQPKKDKKEKKK